jgi:hypothetical protein
MTNLERATVILWGIVAAAGAAAIAVAAFHTSWSVGVAAATIAAGITTILVAFNEIDKVTDNVVARSEAQANGTGAATAARNSERTRTRNLNIPGLATGAVIPGGKPFLALLGDQPKGKTNIEAPLDTLVEAFKQAQGSPTFIVEAKGSMAPFIRMLNLEIRKEQHRASIY